MARPLLGQNAMATVSPFRDLPSHAALRLLSEQDRLRLLRIAAAFVWADFEVADTERSFLAELARALDVDDPATTVELLLDRPPAENDIDPSAVRPAAADVMRQVALHAIAADGRVDEEELEMFDLLDDLLPRSSPAATVRRDDGDPPLLAE